MRASSAIGAERTTELVLQFVEEVRDDFDIGLQELLTVQRLLVELAARGALPDDPIELEGYLRPILTSNRREHQAFPDRYRTFLQRAAPKVRSGTENLETRLEALRVRKFLLGAALTAGLSAGVVGVAWQFYAEAKTQPRPAVEHPTDRSDSGATPANPPGGAAGFDSGGRNSAGFSGGGTSSAGAAKAAVPPELDSDRDRLRAWHLGLLLVLVALLAWLSVKAWLNGWARTILESATREYDVDAESLLLSLPPARLVAAPAIRLTSTVMRARQAAHAFELDVQGTIRATARQAGFFSEVRRGLTRVPEYLFLLERRHPEDLECARHDDLLDQLQERGVNLHRFYFREDASIVHSPAALQPARTLRELEGAFHSHRVAVFAEVDSMMDPVTAELVPWAAQLATWTQPVLLTSSSTDPSLPALERLRAGGFRVIEASPAGLAAVFGVARTAAATEAVDQGLVLPSLLREDARRWLGAQPPEADTLERMLRQLSTYLGRDGFRWLSACALYPRIRWSLVVALARTLELGPLDSDSPLVRKLTLLPWMRQAHLPAWLRSRLLADLPAPERERLQYAVERIFVSAALPSNVSTEQLRDRGQLRLLYRELTRRWEETPDLPSPRDDILYLGATGDSLALRVPRALRSLVDGLRQRASGELQRRDLVQVSYGALTFGYVLQLLAFVLPANPATTMTLALFVGCCVGLLGASVPASDGRWSFWARVSSRGFVVLTSLLGAALFHIDYDFGEVHGVDNLLLTSQCLIALGLPISFFERSWARATGVAALLVASFIYKANYSEIDWNVDIPWLGLQFEATQLSYSAALSAAARLVPVAFGLAFAFGLVELIPAPHLQSRLRSARDFVDRFAIDRLLFDRANAEPKPAGQFATAMGAAVFGFVVGAASSFDFGRSVVWLQVLCGVVAAAFVAFPHLAASRYQEPDRRWPLARAAVEYALVIGVALAVRRQEVNPWLTYALPVAGTASLIAAMPFRIRSERLRRALERAAPDRLMGTMPSFAGIANANVLAIVAVGFYVASKPTPRPPDVPGYATSVAGVGVDSGGSAGGNPEFAGSAGLGGSAGAGVATSTSSASGGKVAAVKVGVLVVNPRPTVAFFPALRMPTRFYLGRDGKRILEGEVGKPVTLEPADYDVRFPTDPQLLNGQIFNVTIRAGERFDTPLMVRAVDGRIVILGGTAQVILAGPKRLSATMGGAGFRVPPGQYTLRAEGFEEATVTIQSGQNHTVTLRRLAKAP